MKTECYGRIFPDMLDLRINRENRGKVFGAFVQSVGVGVQNRRVSLDSAAWEECTKCADYRSCYDLSLGKLALQEAVLRYG
jgi:hypothetical protein